MKIGIKEIKHGGKEKNKRKTWKKGEGKKDGRKEGKVLQGSSSYLELIRISARRGFFVSKLRGKKISLLR